MANPSPDQKECGFGIWPNPLACHFDYLRMAHGKPWFLKCQKGSRICSEVSQEKLNTFGGAMSEVEFMWTLLGGQRGMRMREVVDTSKSQRVSRIRFEHILKCRGGRKSKETIGNQREII